MSENKEPALVPARYIGGHVVDLTQTGRKWLNIDGSTRTKLVLHNGDTVMMPAAEILGQTLFTDRTTGRQWHLGVGRVMKAEHQDVPTDELPALGYEFHDGRPDFEVIEVEQTRLPEQPEEIAASIEVDGSRIAEEEVK